jgi:hypothetical protein
MSSDFPQAAAKMAEVPLDLLPSLGTTVEAQGLDAAKLTVGLAASSENKMAPSPRNHISVTDGAKVAGWDVPALRELFRGNRVPPNLERYPPEYVPYFAFIEQHVSTLFHQSGDRTDQQMEEIYSLLRRKPDARSIGAEHDYLWQAAVLMLGKHALSAAEYEAIIGRVEASVRAMAMRPVSRNYAAQMHRHCH